MRSRVFYVLFLVVALVAGAVTALESGPSASASPAGPARAAVNGAATQVSKEACRRVDPNLVNGVCLHYAAGDGDSYTWLGTYRAPTGRIFFCIDYLYDSRLPRVATIVDTDGLVNQLDRRIRDREVSALNYVTSRWAGSGSTGSDTRDAAIALIIREVMADGVRRDGTVVYPRGLRVGERVQPPIGGLDATVMTVAQEMWRAASRYRGPYDVTLTSRDDGPVRLGRTRTYRVAVTSAAGRQVPGVDVRFACDGPVRCPRPVTTKRRPVRLVVRPRAIGGYRIAASVTGPSSDGRLYVVGSWRTHDGRTARPAGVQRGWIAGKSRATAVVRARAAIVPARPEVVTRTSHPVVTPGAEIHDVVEVSGLPVGYRAEVRASLYGPFEAQPGPSDCVDGVLAGQVTFPVAGNGTHTTPSITVGRVGYYTWVEDFPGDERTLPVTTRCGIVEETTRVVRATPRVSTVASDQHALVGARIHDTVTVTGLPPGSSVAVHWRLHGPVAPRGDGSCDRLDWTKAPIVDRGVFMARGDGTHRSGRTVLRAAGCYTYSEWLPQTATTNPTSSEPGIPLETALVTRPAIPYVPEVPTGPGLPGATAGPLRIDGDKSYGAEVMPSARVQARYLTARYESPAELVRRDVGATLSIPAAGIEAPVDTVGLDRGTMAVPNEPRRVGWLESSAGPMDAVGSSVISGHVSDRSDRPGALSRLGRVEVGDRVRWTMGGRTDLYEVRSVRRYSRAGGLPNHLFRTDGSRLLHLVTCASRVRRASGFHYTDNLVVTAARL